MDGSSYLDSKNCMYRFVEDIDADDSGVEELAYGSYLEYDSSRCDMQQSQPHTDYPTPYHDYKHGYQHSNYLNIHDDDDDEFAYVDDDNDEDYKPTKSSGSKKERGRPSKKRGSHKSAHYRQLQYDASFYTPDKQMSASYSDLDSENSASLRTYARKVRTPRTIMKMMERHRESERVRHHSLNESLKDVCMRVPGYDPSTKETKVIQMQRIIGYECFLENTLRELCDQVSIPQRVYQGNSNFITDAMKNTPMETFYQQSNYRMDEDDDDSFKRSVLGHRRARKGELPFGRIVVKDSGVDEDMATYKREKISSPTVDSTTGNIVQLYPESSSHDSSGRQNHPGHVSSYNQGYSHEFAGQSGLVNGVTEAYDWASQRFVPIDSPQTGCSSQESGIKIETQSVCDEQPHFSDIDYLIEDGLYQGSEQFKDVTPSFMREETVTTSTDDCEGGGFDLSSPDRHTNNKVFLHSPPSRGIWHSSSKLNLSSNSDTPGCKEMQTVSPENILETKPKIFNTEKHPPRDGFIPRHGLVAKYPAPSGSLVTPPKSYGQQMPVHSATVWKWSGPAAAKVYEHFKPNSALLNAGNTFGVTNVRQVTTSASTPQQGNSNKKSVPNVRNVRINIVNPAASYGQRNVQIKSGVVSAASTCGCSSTGTHGLTKVTEHGRGNYPVISNGTVLQTLATIKTEPVAPKYNDYPGPAAMKCGPPTVAAIGLGSAAVKNKRKRYVPFRAPFLTLLNQDNLEKHTECNMECKKPRLEYKELVGMPKPAFTSNQLFKNHRDETQITSCTVTQMKDRDVSGGSSYQNVNKIDHRKSTWMNGFMMFCQINRQKFTSSFPGLHTSAIQKMMGHKWRNMKPEEQAPYREKAQQCSTYLQETQAMSESTQTSYSILQREMDKEIIPAIISITSSNLSDSL